MLINAINKFGGLRVSAMDLYADMFQLIDDYIQNENEDKGSFKANPLGYGKDNLNKTGNYRIMFRDTFEENLKYLQEKDFAIINGLTYFGRKNIQEHASKMFAMIIDLDGVTESSLGNFFFGANNGHYPVPNYVSLSGHGVHLYYLFDEPLDLYPNIKLQLKELKYALMRKIWNMNNTSLWEKVQYQGINQGFRVIGGKTKIQGVRVEAYSFNTHPFTIEQLCSYVEMQITFDLEQKYAETKMSLTQAKNKYPKWYDEVVIGRAVKKGHWVCKEDLYCWWLRKIQSDASYGHRYFAVMCLAIYAIKSGVSFERLKEDSYALIDRLSGLKSENPFTKQDIDSALECYDLKYIRFPIDDISKISAIRIEKNKRNFRKQDVHLKVARATRDIIHENWREGNGRPSAEQQVTEWRIANPEGRKVDCIKELELSKKTVYKWWDNKECEQ